MPLLPHEFRFGYFGFFLIVICMWCVVHIERHRQHMLTIFRRNDPMTVYIVIICYYNVLVASTPMSSIIYIHMLGYAIWEVPLCYEYDLSSYHSNTFICTTILNGYYSSSIELILMSTHWIPFIFNRPNVYLLFFFLQWIHAKNCSNTHHHLTKFHWVQLSHYNSFY